MKLIHLLTAVLWLANSILWAGYAHNWFMALTSGAAALVAAWIAYRADNYTYPGKQ